MSGQGGVSLDSGVLAAVIVFAPLYIFWWSIVALAWLLVMPWVYLYRYRQGKAVSPYAAEWKAGYERARSHAA